MWMASMTVLLQRSLSSLLMKISKQKERTKLSMRPFPPLIQTDRRCSGSIVTHLLTGPDLHSVLLACALLTFSVSFQTVFLWCCHPSRAQKCGYFFRGGGRLSLGFISFLQTSDLESGEIFSFCMRQRTTKDPT